MIFFEKVTKIFDSPAIRELTLEIKKGEILVLLGKSGSGKTTTLRLINRLIDPTAGQIFLDGKDTRTIDPINLRRQMGYAIQHVGLFPHLTVEENIGILPRLLGWSSKTLSDRINYLLELVGLDPKMYRRAKPHTLSGGQMQRVGVARALAIDPPILLMDEPFGALDPVTRNQLQDELLLLQTKLKKTVVFVTHDIYEAFKLGCRIALLDEGNLIQLGTPQSLKDHPATELVKEFIKSVH